MLFIAELETVAAEGNETVVREEIFLSCIRNTFIVMDQTYYIDFI